MASQEVQALLSGGASFEGLVAQLLVPDNDLRKHAEGVFEQLKEDHADACVQLLVNALRRSQSEEYRSFSAIMLRKVCPACCTRMHT